MYLSSNLAGIPIVDDIGAGVQNLLSTVTGGAVPEANIMPGETGGVPGNLDPSVTAGADASITPPAEEPGVSTTTIIGLGVVALVAWWIVS